MTRRKKPADPVSDLANAGMYVFEPAIFDHLARCGATRPLDIGYHLLPRLVGQARALAVDAYFRDIGTLDAYQRAQHEWKPGVLQ